MPEKHNIEIWMRVMDELEANRKSRARFTRRALDSGRWDEYKYNEEDSFLYELIVDIERIDFFLGQGPRRPGDVLLDGL